MQTVSPPPSKEKKNSPLSSSNRGIDNFFLTALQQRQPQTDLDLNKFNANNHVNNLSSNNVFLSALSTSAEKEMYKQQQYQVKALATAIGEQLHQHQRQGQKSQVELVEIKSMKSSYPNKNKKSQKLFNSLCMLENVLDNALNGVSSPKTDANLAIVNKAPTPVLESCNNSNNQKLKSLLNFMAEDTVPSEQNPNPALSNNILALNQMNALDATNRLMSVLQHHQEQQQLIDTNPLKNNNDGDISFASFGSTISSGLIDKQLISLPKDHVRLKCFDDNYSFNSSLAGSLRYSNSNHSTQNQQNLETMMSRQNQQQVSSKFGMHGNNLSASSKQHNKETSYQDMDTSSELVPSPFPKPQRSSKADISEPFQQGDSVIKRSLNVKRRRKDYENDDCSSVGSRSSRKSIILGRKKVQDQDNVKEKRKYADEATIDFLSSLKRKEAEKASMGNARNSSADQSTLESGTTFESSTENSFSRIDPYMAKKNEYSFDKGTSFGPSEDSESLSSGSGMMEGLGNFINKEFASKQILSRQQSDLSTNQQDLNTDLNLSVWDQIFSSDSCSKPEQSQSKLEPSSTDFRLRNLDQERQQELSDLWKADKSSEISRCKMVLNRCNKTLKQQKLIKKSFSALNIAEQINFYYGGLSEYEQILKGYIISSEESSELFSLGQAAEDTLSSATTADSSTEATSTTNTANNRNLSKADKIISKALGSYRLESSSQIKKSLLKAKYDAQDLEECSKEYLDFLYEVIEKNIENLNEFFNDVSVDDAKHYYEGKTMLKDSNHFLVNDLSNNINAKEESCREPSPVNKVNCAMFHDVAKYYSKQI